MVKAKDYTCIGCPIGCPLQLVHKGIKITEISGNECDRGAKYAKQEFTDPRRGLSELQVKAPVKLGQVLIEDILGEKGIDVVACRSMEKMG
jgi:CxxC motif-containing protein